MQLEPSWVFPPSLNPVVMLLVSLVTAGLFVLSGMMVSVPLLRRGLVPRRYFTISTLLAACSVGLALYFIFVIDVRLGKLACLAVYAGCAATAIFILQKLRRTKKRALKSWVGLFILPICLAFAVSVFYNSLLMNCEMSDATTKKTQYCAILYTTFDNTLPLSFAVAAYKGVDKPAVSDWRGADRPPLQSGIMLLDMPWTSRLGTLTANYQILVCFLQCLWVVGLWEFLRLVIKDGRKLALALVVAILNSFIFANSIFAWPKMLSAALLLCAMVVGLRALKAKRVESADVVLFAAGSTLAMLAHGGVIFTLAPGMALLVFWAWRYLTLKHAMIFAGVAGVLYTPWLLYRWTYHLAGDRLIKWWLGGHPAVDDMSTSRTLMNAYAVPAQDILANKLGNVRTLAGHIPIHGVPLSDQMIVNNIRNMEATYFLPSLSLMWLGVVGFIKSLAKNKKGWGYFQTYFYESRAIVICLASLVFWLLLSYGPPDAPTNVITGSYATFLMLGGVLLMYLTRTPRLLRFAVVVSVVYFSTVSYIYMRAATSINLGYLAMTFVSVAIIAYLLDLTARVSIEPTPN